MVTLGTNFQMDQCLFQNMIMVIGVQMVGSFYKMDRKAEKSETQRIEQDMEQHGSTFSRKVEMGVLIGTYFKG